MEQKHWSCAEAVELSTWAEVLPIYFANMPVAATTISSARKNPQNHQPFTINEVMITLDSPSTLKKLRSEHENRAFLNLYPPTA